ncbi:helix-turn-helix domain-containing protein [Amycolatopsis sp. cmx-11-32]|uniref:helix-turn-helix domain-containing protein n=1 Tax=Amycolatopsis sp. cmx-11-32 TaxID=2785796 RepID=UPI0039E63C7C
MVDDELAKAVGSRVLHHRTLARKSRPVIAGLAGISISYLDYIEHGRKLPALPDLLAIAEALEVEPGELLQARPAKPLQRAAVLETGDLHRAVTMPTMSEPMEVAELSRHVRTLWKTWQTSPNRYTELTAALPGIIEATTATVRGDASGRQRQANAVAADLYGLLRTVAKRVGLPDLSLLAVDRAITAAEQADDPVRLAGAHWNLAQVHLADRRPAEAEDAAMTALDALRAAVGPERDDVTAMSGALLLIAAIAAIAAVRKRKPWVGREQLRQAAPLADRVGDSNICWTAFGPANLAMYSVAIEVETGEAAEGLRLASKVDSGRVPSIERRVAFLLDSAKGFTQRRDFSQAMTLLETAHAEAPEDITFRPAAHALVRMVLQRGRRDVSRKAAHLAGTAGLAL